jgi:hypothetical protein
MSDRRSPGFGSPGRGLVAAFRAAAREAGCDPAELSAVVRPNVPISHELMGADRPYLGGSPDQIAEDLARLSGADGVDHVLFNDTSARDPDEYVHLLERLQAAVGASR